VITVNAFDKKQYIAQAIFIVALIIGFVIITGPAQTREQVWVPQGAQIVNQVDSVNYLKSQSVEFGSIVVMEVPYTEFRDKIGRGDVATSIESGRNDAVVYYYSRSGDILYVSNFNHPGTWFRQIQTVELVGNQLVVHEEGFSMVATVTVTLVGTFGGAIFSFFTVLIIEGALEWWKEKAFLKKQAVTQ
jgi:hypothetical protein